MNPRRFRPVLTMPALLGTGAMVLTSCAEGADGQNDGEDAAAQELAIFAVNDFHGGLANGRELACAVETQRGAHPDHLLISAGDDVGASQFESAVQDDQPTLDYFNALGVDASALGNHEFDEGYADITDRLEPEADFDHLAANLFEAGSDERAAEPFQTYEVGGLTVAVVGGVTDETPELVVAEGVADVEFRDPIDSVNEVIDGELEDEADVIIAAFHEGSPEDVEMGETPEDSWSERIREELDPSVDAVLEGHTHNEYGYLTDDFAVIQTGANGMNLGQITLTVDPESGEVTAEEPELLPSGEFDVEDCAGSERYQAAEEVILEAEEHAEEVGSEVLTLQDGDLTTAWSADQAEYEDGVWSTEGSGHGDERSEQSVLGSFTADFLQDTDHWPEEIAPDLALINAGGIRDDIREDGEPEVSLRDAADVMPFNNRLAVVELTGEQIGELLEQQWGEEGYHQLGLSSNLRYTFDSEAEDGEGITSIMVEGEPVEDDQTYRVGVQEFLADGGDGFTVLAEAQQRHDTEIIDTEIWPEHLGEMEILEPDYALRAVEVAGLDPQQELAPGEELSFEVSEMHSLSLGAPEVTEVEASIEQNGASYDLTTADYTVEDGEGTAQVGAELPEELDGGEAVLVLSADAGGTVAEVPLTIAES